MLRVCATCTTRYAIGLPACPHCGAGDAGNYYDHEEDPMPKATVHGGSSNADAPAAPVVADGSGRDGTAADAVPPDNNDVTVNAGVAAGTGAGISTTDPAPEPETEVEVERDPGMPGDGALKAEWVTYAVDHLGVDQAEADAMTKAELILLVRGA